ncbi:major facilitator superfamily domain-containing protein [Massariosphaeria phaeospora]|uniref:Major facilitator superfamily domain-containing protein n=1 Tax=Massariosphaeria phaeospora TaxID=100035 RepID=A0A7C8I1G2_9PLEO|nr:major facilitator superfamily domain-containing protein [Massariosphaeria phaeospora]
MATAIRHDSADSPGVTTVAEIPQLDPKPHERLFDLDTVFSETRFCHHTTGEERVVAPPAKLANCTDPANWSPGHKWFSVSIACASVAMSSFAAGSYGPIVDLLAEYWNLSELVSNVGILIFALGFATSPMVLAPLSELSGRKPVILGSGLMFLIFTIGCSVAKVYWVMLFCRFFAAFGSATFAMGNGVITDIYDRDSQNTPMALFASAAVSGIGLGPLVCGFIAEYADWRWVFHLQTIIVAVLIGLTACFGRESRVNPILTQKAKVLNNWYEKQERQGYYALVAKKEESEALNVLQSTRCRPRLQGDEPSGLWQIFIQATIFPAKLLVTEGVVFFFSLWATFSWSVLYVCISGVSKMYQEQYGFSLSQSNAIFAAVCVGGIVGGVLGVFQEMFGRYCFWMIGGSPEARLYFIRLEATLLPIGLIVFGWGGEEQVHWMVPAIAVGIGSVGITVIYLAVFNYLSDSYGDNSSSAIAAQNLMRNGVCGFFVLFTAPKFDALGYGVGCSIFAGIGLVLSLVPWVLARWGRRIRKNSAIAKKPPESAILDETLVEAQAELRHPPGKIHY